MKVLKLRKLSVKIIITLLLIFIIMTSFLRIAAFTIYKVNTDTSSNIDVNVLDDDGRIDINILYIVLLIIGIIIIILFYIAINFMLVSRIKRLNSAVNEAVKGNFDTFVHVRGKDELSELTDSFNKMTYEMKTNEYLSKEFVRNVSHEFKTPLSAIRGYAELVGDETEDKNLKNYANIIIDESDRLTSLCKSILQLSLLEGTTITKLDDIVNPSEQIKSILRLTNTIWEEKEITFELNMQDFTMKSNEQMLYQVWQNLISNAIKFSNKNGKIIINLSKNEMGLNFYIKDNGIGIAEENKDKIFTQFYVEDKSRNADGNGLGLPLTEKIIKKLGGKITFESQYAQGSTFYVYL